MDIILTGRQKFSAPGDAMHELSIMESALNLAFEQARQARAAQVHVLRLRIGRFSGVVPEALQFAFETLKLGTLAANARLEIESVPARFWCPACTVEFPAPNLPAECPDCHSFSGELRAGRELELASLEIE